MAAPRTSIAQPLPGSVRAARLARTATRRGTVAGDAHAVHLPRLAEASPAAAAQPACDIEFVIPVYNEQVALPVCIARLHRYLSEHLPWSFRITIADNASIDGTLTVARGLASAYDGVRVVHLDRKGRGNALRQTWLASDAAVVAYMDVDLSTDLAGILPLVAPLMSGHSDLAIGSRLSRSSRVVRGPKREFISRSYNLVLRTALQAKFSDAQCGFKAMRRDPAQALLPLVEDGNWFWDTELLVLAERSGLRIHEVPVDWVDDPDTRVNIVQTALEDLRGCARVGTALVRGTVPLTEVRAQLGREALDAGEHQAALPGQVVSFVAIGVASTLAYLVLYALLRTGMGAQAANLLALLVTAVANTAANRRMTFGQRGTAGSARAQVEGLAIFGAGVAITSGSLAGLDAVAPHAGRALEMGVLVFANAVVTLGRFLAFRLWVFHPRRRASSPANAPSSAGARAARRAHQRAASPADAAAHD